MSESLSTKVILVRHGRTNYNELGKYQGSSDRSVLIEKGYKNAYTTGMALKKYNFDIVYSSPLTRVRQTTEAIISVFNRPNIPVRIEHKLTEVCMADWEGLYYREVKEKYPDDYNCWQNTPHLFTRDGVNYPVVELFDRAKEFWDEVLKKHRGKTILIVAHGGTNRALISTAINLSPSHYHSLQQCNCGISYLEFSAFNNFGKLKFFNSTNHLGKVLPKLKAGKTGWRWLLLSNDVIKEKLDDSYLLKILQQGYIDLILTDNIEKSENLANNLLKNNSSAFHISIDNNDFLLSWQKTIIEKQKRDCNSSTSTLFTGLIIVSNELRAKFLSQTIDTEFYIDTIDNLAIIHYSDLNRRSILQGILPLNLISSRVVGY